MDKMVRAVWLTGILEPLSQARAEGTSQASVSVDTPPQLIDDLDTTPIGTLLEDPLC